MADNDEVKKSDELTGKEKAAILLISLDKERAAQVLQAMDKKEVEILTEEIARWENVPPDLVKKVWQEFYQLSLTSSYLNQGGKKYAEEILNRALGNHRALNMVDNFRENSKEENVEESFFELLEKIEPKDLLNFIKSEHPQTIALILSYLKPEKASMILSSLPEKLQFEVTMRIINIGEISPEVLRQIDRTLRKEFSSISTEEKLQAVGGTRAAAEILNMVDRQTQEQILNVLEKKNTELAREVKQLMFVFEDILSIDDRSIQRALREIDTKDLTLALKGASKDLREKFFKNMSSRAANTIKEEMELMGPVRMRDVEEVQQKIANIFRELGEKGEIIIGSGKKEELIV
ncbi:MAG TPA: flagellar motor switch protein FliG [Candidatus Aerophobetes bacterium]|uniref:Flagellar motor switch protein FliG n=2 Tax=Aerophobetes bacterium TaxID=2030807 RepID=A0A7V0MYL9_UNCAE|nr:flagellar motor switch protein FliG [Candidatus Aerophobetes bacterium]